jgi:hypothetical protein
MCPEVTRSRALGDAMRQSNTFSRAKETTARAIDSSPAYAIQPIPRKARPSTRMAYFYDAPPLLAQGESVFGLGGMTVRTRWPPKFLNIARAASIPEASAVPVDATAG